MRLLHAVFHPTTPGRLRQVPAVEMLRRTWVQEFQIEDETVIWRYPKNIPPAGQRVVSPYDSADRAGSKRDTDWPRLVPSTYSAAAQHRLPLRRTHENLWWLK
ncbi:hypothetical protein ACWGEU_04920 [Streptomyces goshikiensis]|uniref:hypothetical protein n=1 Tax=Streptomyces goshikiensis TaxID=1942 RepID=UPI002ADFE5CE|nr:hypothetical protein [Streptomyces goshikiensis]